MEHGRHCADDGDGNQVAATLQPNNKFTVSLSAELAGLWHNIGMADYKLLLAHENQKLEVLRDTRARVDQQIAESEQFIKVLTSRRAANGGKDCTDD